jgi:hypothetical protein
MKLRILSLFVIFTVSTWPPYAAQQTSTPQAAPQSPTASPTLRKGLANSTCAPCDHAKHDAKPSPAHQAQRSQARPVAAKIAMTPNPAMICCEGKDPSGPSISSTRDGKACGGNGKCCSEPEDGKPCRSNNAMACNAKDRKACGAGCTEQCCASHGK